MFSDFSIKSSFRAARCSAIAFAGFVAAMFLLAATPLHADVYKWVVVPSGDWSDAGSWLNSEGSAGVPTSNDTAYVVNGGTAAITTQPGAVCNNLYLGDPNSANSGTIQISSSGSLSTSTNEYLGNSGTGTLIQSGGTNNIGEYLYLGNQAGGAGTYILSGSGYLSASGTFSSGGSTYYSQENVGNSASGTFTQTGGTNTCSYLNLGNYGVSTSSGGGPIQAGPVDGVPGDGVPGGPPNGGGVAASGSGTYSLSDSGYLSVANYENVGWSGTGVFTQSGGINNCNNLSLGSSVGASGTYSLSGNGQLVAGNENLGYSGSGSFTQSGGKNNVGGWLYLGFNSGRQVPIPSAAAAICRQAERSPRGDRRTSVKRMSAVPAVEPLPSRAGPTVAPISRSVTRGIRRIARRRRYLQP